MKKLLSLVTAFMLFGLFAANAEDSTVLFTFTGMGGEAYSYVEMSQDGNPIELTKSTYDVTYEDDINIVIKVKEATEYKIEVSAGTSTVDDFNSYGVGYISSNGDDTEWTFELEQLGYYTFSITVKPINGGETGPSDEYQKIVNLKILGIDYENVYGTFWREENFSDIEELEFSSSSISIDYDNYLGISISSDEEIEIICQNPNCVEDVDYSLTKEDYDGQIVWYISLNSESPETITFYISRPDTLKTASLNLLNGNEDLITGYVLYSEEEYDYLTLTHNEETFVYYNYLGFTIYSSDNNLELIVTCANEDLTLGTDYELEEEDGSWFITLTEESPENITFNIYFPDLAEVSKTVNLNVENGDANDITAVFILSNNADDYQQVNFSNNAASYDYTDFIEFTIYSMNEDEEFEDIEVVCSDSNYVEGTDYVLVEEDGIWRLTLNGDSPENITFDISFPVGEVTNPTVTLNFTGEGIVEDLTVEYFDYNDASKTYSPESTPFTFDYSSEVPSGFIVSAEGYEFTITLSEVDAAYASNISISGNEVTLSPLNVDLTFNVLVEKGKTDAINSILLDQNAEIYNIQGLRINDTSKLSKGLYIINGKKVLVK